MADDNSAQSGHIISKFKINWATFAECPLRIRTCK